MATEGNDAAAAHPNLPDRRLVSSDSRSWSSGGSGSSDSAPLQVTGLRQRITAFLFRQALAGRDVELQGQQLSHRAGGDGATGSAAVPAVQQAISYVDLLRGGRDDEAGCARVDAAAGQLSGAGADGRVALPSLAAPGSSSGNAVTQDSAQSGDASMSVGMSTPQHGLAAPCKQHTERALGHAGSQQRSAATLAALQAFHQRRNALQDLNIEAVHAVAQDRVLLLATFPRAKLAPMLLLYNWRSTFVEAAHMLVSQHALAGMLWCGL